MAPNKTVAAPSRVGDSSDHNKAGARGLAEPAPGGLPGQTSEWDSGRFSSSEEAVGEVGEQEQQQQQQQTETDLEMQRAAEQGNRHFHRLGWKRLTVVLLVEAIALGALSVPAAFASLGLVLGLIVCVGIGLVALYTAYSIGRVKLRYPHVSHYADAGRLLMGRFGYEFVGAMFALQLITTIGSHCLTGAIALVTITGDTATCSVVFGFVSALVLLLLAVPPSFAEVAVLGYVDFVSIITAISITIIATGIQYSSTGQSGQAAPPSYQLWPKAGLSLPEAFIAIANIVFAYGFGVCQFSFMDEMHTPADFPKAIWALSIIQISIYSLTGALVYVFVGQDVQAPALLSAGRTVSKVAFGVALPVIFISGAINTTVAARYIHGRVYARSVVRFVNTRRGWVTWLALITAITVIAWIIAESIPFFSDLLSICSCLFISGFTFYFPALFWFKLLKEGHWYEMKNIVKSIANGIVFVIGILVLSFGTYSSVVDIINGYENGTVRRAFSCVAA